MNNMTKKTYNAPELTIVTVAAERGFAESFDSTSFRIMRDQAFEIVADFNPINDYETVTDCDNPFANGSTPPSNNFWNF